MSKFILALGAAALAIGAPAIAQQEGKGGGDKGQGGGNKGGQKAERGGGNQGGGNKDRGNGGGQMKADRGNGGAAVRQGGGNDRGNDRARGDTHKMEKARGNDRNDNAIRVGNRDGLRDGQGKDRNLDSDDNGRMVSRNFGGFGGGYDNCPPGLAKKDNGCLPPGQAKKYLGTRLQQSFSNNLIPSEYRRWYRDDNDHFYRFGEDNIYRVNRNNNLVDGLIPLFAKGDNRGGYYALGDQWPESYDFYNVPYQYRSYYGDSSDYRYRYGDGAIYRINSGSGVVDGIVALLAGDLGVGRQLPTGYDTYNVPFSYRDRYADSDDNWYRYNDGYIYQVDPKTRLISAVIDAIV